MMRDTFLRLSPFILTIPVSATVIATDNFNSYAPLADLNGQGAGTGFTSTWSAGTAFDTNGSAVVYNNALGQQDASRALASAAPTTGQIWFSLGLNTAATAGIASFAFTNGGAVLSEFGDLGAATAVWGVNNGSATTNSSTGLAILTNYTMVGVADYVNDLVVLWINPTGTASYNPSTGVAVGATAQTTGFTTTTAITGIRFRTSLALGTTYDNLVIATSGSDVGLSLIPEPSLSSLVGLAGLGLLWRRHREEKQGDRQRFSS